MQPVQAREAQPMVRTRTRSLDVLVVDPNVSDRADVVFYLDLDERVGSIQNVASADEARVILSERSIDAIFIDVSGDGRDGMNLAYAVRELQPAPAIVFITSATDHAVEAFDLRAIDYLLKPLRDERLFDAVTRILESHAPVHTLPPADEVIPVELGGVTRFVKRSEVRYVEAHGDYARLITATGRHLIRVPLAVLQERWADAGFIRIHRSYLICIHAVDEVRAESGRISVRINAAVLDVSRRHTREFRERLFLRGA